MKKFCLVCSGGGHLSEILQIKKNSNIKNFFFIINSKIDFKNKKKIYFISHGVRGIKLIINLIPLTPCVIKYIFFLFLKYILELIIKKNFLILAFFLICKISLKWPPPEQTKQNFFI